MQALTPEELHQQYTQTVAAYRALIPAPALRMTFSHQLDGYFRQYLLGLWKAGGESVEQRQVDIYNAVWSQGNPAPAALYWEVATGVAQAGDFCPPAFFADLRSYDRQHASDLSRRFADQLTLLLLLFASADGGVSEAEAGYVNACNDILLEQCRLDGIRSDSPGVNAGDYVSRRTPGKSASQAPAAPQKQTQEQDKAQTQDQPEEKPLPTLDELLAQLDGLCGLDQVKKDVKSLINLVKVRKLRQQADLPVPPMSLHLVFLGNPGTGKTTVARLLAQIYRAVGVLSKGQLVEVDRSGLVAGYVGQTALKTQEAVQKALGGVLFIDEAYALVNQDSVTDFGREAIEVLLKNMEDHRDDLIVIVAGYTNLMEKFIHSNPGLESRFNKYFYFEDYTAPQLLEIFRSMCTRGGYTLSAEGEGAARKLLDQLYEDRDENFGNARDVRNLFEKAVTRQSDRVALLDAPTREQLMELLPQDIDEPEEP